MHVGCAWDKCPAMEDVLESVQFFAHGVIKLCLEGATHGHLVGWIVLVVFRGGLLFGRLRELGMENPGVDDVVDK